MIKAYVMGYGNSRIVTVAEAFALLGYDINLLYCKPEVLERIEKDKVAVDLDLRGENVNLRYHTYHGLQECNGRLSATCGEGMTLFRFNIVKSYPEPSDDWHCVGLNYHLVVKIVPNKYETKTLHLELIIGV